jgi:hypothetical protein
MGEAMSRRVCRLWLVAPALVLVALGGCAGNEGLAPASPAVSAAIPPAIPAQALVGRWGLGSYHREEDRARTETAARGACAKPYEIAPGPTGGVIMHLADQPEPQELVLKGAPAGRTFLGPRGEPGAPQDREIISHDGNTMVMRWVDPEVGARYGTLVFAKCGAATAGRPPASQAGPGRKGQ